ncbi:hypothetical protein D3C84_1015420 [compost metagenome]
MDARRGQVYTAAFASEAGTGAARDGAAEGSWERLNRDGIRLMNEWVDALYERVQDGAPVSITICGELSKHEEEAVRLQRLCEAAGVRVELAPTLIEGRSVALLGLERVLREEYDDVHSFVPNYTQLTEAEVKLKEKQAERDGQ